MPHGSKLNEEAGNFMRDRRAQSKLDNHQGMTFGQLQSIGIEKKNLNTSQPNNNRFSPMSFNHRNTKQMSSRDPSQRGYKTKQPSESAFMRPASANQRQEQETNPGLRQLLQQNMQQNKEQQRQIKEFGRVASHTRNVVTSMTEQAQMVTPH